MLNRLYMSIGQADSDFSAPIARMDGIGVPRSGPQRLQEVVMYQTVGGDLLKIAIP
jgi:hypothetical protein